MNPILVANDLTINALKKNVGSSWIIVGAHVFPGLNEYEYERTSSVELVELLQGFAMEPLTPFVFVLLLVLVLDHATFMTTPPWNPCGELHHHIFITH